MGTQILAALGLAWLIPAALFGQTNLLPAKSTLAVTPANFCLGMKNVAAITKQSFTEEANLLCANQAPTALFTTLINSAYQGTGTPTLTTVLVQETPATLTTQLTVAYAMKVNKDPVKVLLGEEKHVSSSYSQDPLSISAKFMAPPVNSGDADTAFVVQQKTSVKAQVSFDDTSIHDLKLYQLYTYNFDFFLAVRTLTAPTEQFKKSVVLRAIFQDPANQNQSYAVTILNFVMNNRDQHDRTVDAFTKFIQSDFMTLYQEQSK